jgi:uncharacterized membrane protein YvbJ
MLKFCKHIPRSLRFHMPYCRRCGTELADDGHFCQKCGTPVVVTYPSPVPSAPVKPFRSEPLVIAAIVLIAILVGGVVVAVLLTASFATVNIDQSYQDNTVGINRLNLNVESQALKVTFLLRM